MMEQLKAIKGEYVINTRTGDVKKVLLELEGGRVLVDIVFHFYSKTTKFETWNINEYHVIGTHPPFPVDDDIDVEIDEI